ncbi:MAG: cobyrinic acid a,c-diamide synthase [Clostridiales bacterium]|jgi:CO dehydrogenase maturation factor|nr:cobyrinic acid a,c-diamide synthase [Clostridiales bacterium]
MPGDGEPCRKGRDALLEHDTKIIAVAGKGGVGKTSISAAFVRLLTEAYPDKRILAIDADPAVGLSTALGVEVRETLDDIRKSIVASVEDGAPREAIELLSEARYRIFDTMVEQQKFSFLAIGRPETAGCYCKVNAYLKEVINLLAGDFDYVVIDGEAGIEQINRRVMEKVTHLVLITDPSRKGTQVIDTIKRVADELVMYDRCGAIVNRVNDPAMIPYIHIDGTEILAFIGSDSAHAANDIQGRSVFDLPEDAPVLSGAREALKKLEIL